MLTLRKELRWQRAWVYPLW